MVMLNGCMTAATVIGFTEADVRAAAGRQSFERGVQYLGAVASLEIVGNQVIATVRGSEDYLVVLTLGGATAGGARPRAECGCPYGQEGFFCKHCVAVALTVLRDAAKVPAQRSRRAGRVGGPASADQSEPRTAPEPGGEAEPAGLGRWLRSLSRDELVMIVCEHAIEDDDWLARLELRAATAAADVPAVTTRVGGLLLDDDEIAGSRLTGPYGYLEGQESWRYARRIEEVMEAVRDLAAVGHAADAMLIAEEALAAVAEVSRHASDRAGVIADAAGRLLAVHRQACEAAGADPPGLAEFLADRVVRADDIPQIDLADYHDILGEAGLARLRERVSAALEANPAGWAERLAMEQVLTAVGDVDALVVMLAASLDDRGLAHLRIVQVLEEAGRNDDALAWAERGVREPAQPDSRLADFVVGRYCGAGRIEDAVSVRRARFLAAPSADTYGLLRDVAERAGQWESTRDWALGVLRADAARPRASGGWPHWAPGPVLIDVLIADCDIDAAWEAADRVASDAQWLKLAGLVAETRPADALAVYRRQIDKLRSETGDASYELMAKLLTSARECHGRLGTGQAFNSYLRALRADQKRKPKLMRILKAHQL